MIKLTEAQKTGTTAKDSSGRTVFQSTFLFRDLFLNPEHIISINEEASLEVQQKLSRIETIKGSFVVVGTPTEIQKQMNTSKKVLRD